VNGACLDREAIARLLEGQPPLLEGYLDRAAQLQPNGFDLTLREVASFQGAGRLGSAPEQRQLALTSPLQPDSSGWWHLSPGPYLITFNEVVNLPQDLMALGKPRSSLLRSGVAVHNAVWDAGYRGRSQALLVVYNPAGFRVARDTRVLQLVFFRLETPVQEGYRGRFQGEGL
jgi:dUTP pyrophosphatase